MLILTLAQLSDLATTQVAISAGAHELNPLSNLPWPSVVLIKVTAAIVVGAGFLLLPNRLRLNRLILTLSLMVFGICLWNATQSHTIGWLR